jgi:hypothetical protein
MPTKIPRRRLFGTPVPAPVPVANKVQPAREEVLRKLDEARAEYEIASEEAMREMSEENFARLRRLESEILEILSLL